MSVTVGSVSFSAGGAGLTTIVAMDWMVWGVSGVVVGE